MGAICSSQQFVATLPTTYSPKVNEDLKHFIIQIHGKDNHELVSHLHNEADKMFKDIETGMSYAEIRARYG